MWKHRHRKMGKWFHGGKNVAIVAGGTAGAQLIGLACAPVLTSLYVPHQYGIFGVYQSVVSIVAPVVALTLPAAIVLAKGAGEARAITRTAWIAVAAMASLIALALIMAAYVWRVEWTLIQELQWLPLLMGGSALLAGMVQIHQQWCIRLGLYGASALGSLLGAAAAYAAMIMGGLHSPRAGTLVAGALVGLVVNAVIMSLRIHAPMQREIYVADDRGDWDNSGVRKTIEKYRDFLRYRAPQAVMNPVAQGLPVFMLLIFFGPASAGFYALARTVTGAPVALVSKSIGDVLYRKYALANHEGMALAPTIVRATFGLLIIGAIPFTILFVAAPQIAEFTFGKEWTKAGEYIRWMCPWLWLLFANTPANTCIPVLGMLRFGLCLEIFGMGLRALALWSGFRLFDSDIAAVALFGLAGFILNAILIVWVILTARERDRNPALKGGLA